MVVGLGERPVSENIIILEHDVGFIITKVRYIFSILYKGGNNLVQSIGCIFLQKK